MAIYNQAGGFIDNKMSKRRITIGFLMFLIFGSFILYAMLQYLLFRKEHRFDYKTHHRNTSLAEARKFFAAHFDLQRNGGLLDPILHKEKQEHSQLKVEEDEVKEGSTDQLRGGAEEIPGKVDGIIPKYHQVEKMMATSAEARGKIDESHIQSPAGGTRVERNSLGVGFGICRSKFAGDLVNHENPYYSVTDLTQGKGDMVDHLSYLCRNINTTWRKHGWTTLDKVDISNCHIDTPECGLWCEFCGTRPGKSFEDADRPYRKCCVEHKKLRDTAVWTMKTLAVNNIRYFLSTGSAIGAYRHHGTIIPWDTDVDLVVFPEDEDAVKKVFLNQEEHYFQKDPQGKPMYWVHHSKNGKPKGGPHVEIFFQKDYTNHRKELLPLVDCDYYGRYNASCPQTSMLDVWFPSGWRKPNGCHYHSDGRATMYNQGKRQEQSKC